MAKHLIIVESPAKAKTINKYLGNDYKVVASVGHIIDLPPKELGVDVEKNFEPTYKVIRGKSKVINMLKAEAAASDIVYIATDPDREGEAIAWHIANSIEKKNPNISRVRFHEVTKQAILDAVAQADQIDQKRVNAQQARRILDRLVGYKISPVLWKTVSKGLSAGRVQSVALRLICEREQEIEAFVPEEYWSLEGDFLNETDLTLRVKLIRLDGEKPEIHSADEMTPVLEAARADSFQISDIAEKMVQRKPQAPYITSTLQQDASRRLGFSAKKTMTLAQQLYEGLDTGGGEMIGLITYMRTDSRRISNEAVADVREFIGQRYPAALPEKPNAYSSSKNAQDAHEAIRPTATARTPEQLRPHLSDDLHKLYQLIWKRFVASQMKPARFKQTTIFVTGKRIQFSTTGSILVEPGYLSVYDDTDARKDNVLPAGFKAGETMTLQELYPEQHFTKPPARFNESSLVKELDELGIGRPSTYASIISTIVDRQYVTREKKQFQPTELGIIVNKVLVGQFPNIFNVKFTALMEKELDDIEQGRDWVLTLNDFYQPFATTLEEVLAKKDDIKKKLVEKTGEACPECGADLIYKWGRNGKFIACSNFPKCRFTRSLEEDTTPDEPTDEICEVCGKPMVIKTSRFGRFLACSDYPTCKHSRPIDIGIACPEDGCDGRVVERRSRRGKVFYGCSRYPDCKFAAWDPPVNTACPVCNHKFLVRKDYKAGLKYLCPKCKTKFDPEDVKIESA